MASRPQIRKFPLIVNGNMASSITSPATIISDLSMIGYSFSWTGSSPVGTASVQCSNDYAINANGSVANAGTWTTMTLDYNGSLVTSIPISGSTGTAFIDIDAMSAYALQVVYTASSGTGTLQVIVNAKVA